LPRRNREQAHVPAARERVAVAIARRVEGKSSPYPRSL
jgi:hypothetical protein